MPSRVLVTRPEPGASETAARLRQDGYDAIVFPLTQTVPIAVDLPPGGWNAVAVTSANAIRHAPKPFLQELSALPCFAVGAATAEAAREAGFSTVIAGPGDALALAALLAGSTTGPLLYLCGKIRLPRFERALGDAGVAVRPLETYDTLPRHPDAADLEAVLGGKPVDVALVTSVGAARVLAGLVGASPPPLLNRIRIVCLSERIAAAMGTPNPARLFWSREPNQASLLRRLREILPPQPGHGG